MGGTYLRYDRGVETGLLFRYLDTNGDGTGTKSATGDYSGAATQFFIAPPAGWRYHVSRMMVQIAGVGVDSGTYGGLAALTNGIAVQKRSGATTVVTDLTDGLPVKTNHHWSRLCYDVRLDEWGNPADIDYVQVRWTFSKTDGALRLDGDQSERLSVVLNDDMGDASAALSSHYFMVNGFLISKKR